MRRLIIGALAAFCAVSAGHAQTTTSTMTVKDANGAVQRVRVDQANDSSVATHNTIETGGTPVGLTNPLAVQIPSSFLNGLSTSANQTTANSSLATIATNTTSLATSANQGTANSSLATIVTNSGVVSGAVSSGKMQVFDANNAAFQGVTAITPGTPVTAARSLGYVVTVAGNVTLTLADASTITLALSVSPQLQTLPFAVTNVALGTNTAGSFWNLK